MQDALIERFKLLERYDEKYKVDARKELSKNARISVGKDGLITVEVDDKEAQVSAELANAHVEELRRLLGQLAVTEAQQRRLFFEKQLNQTQDKLTQAERALRNSGVDASALKSNPQAAVTAVAQLQAQVTAQEVKVASLRGYLAESAPDFRQAMTELGALRAQLNSSKTPTARPAAMGTTPHATASSSTRKPCSSCSPSSTNWPGSTRHAKARSSRCWTWPRRRRSGPSPGRR